MILTQETKEKNVIQLLDFSLKEEVGPSCTWVIKNSLNRIKTLDATQDYSKVLGKIWDCGETLWEWKTMNSNQKLV